MFPTVGYEWTSKNTAVDDRLVDQEPSWRSLLLACRLEPSAHLGLSMHSLRKRKAPQADLLVAEQEHWLSSTALLLLLLGFWPLYRRRAADKARCKAAAKLFLSSTCDRDRLLAVDFLEVSSADALCCVSPARINGRCSCLVGWLTASTGELQHHSDLYGAIVDLFIGLAGIDECLSCKAHVGSLCARLATVVDDSRCEWGRGWTAKTCTRLTSAKGRRCRADPHTKELVVAGTDPHSQRRGDAQALEAMGELGTSRAGWEDQLLTELMASGHLICKRPSTISSAMDASRIGQPAVDMVVHAAWHHAAQGLIPLPPAVVWGLWRAEPTFGLQGRDY